MLRNLNLNLLHARTERHEGKGDTDSWISEESDDEIVALPPSKQD